MLFGFVLTLFNYSLLEMSPWFIWHTYCMSLVLITSTHFGPPSNTLFALSSASPHSGKQDTAQSGWPFQNLAVYKQCFPPAMSATKVSRLTTEMSPYHLTHNYQLQKCCHATFVLQCSREIPLSPAAAAGDSDLWHWKANGIAQVSLQTSSVTSEAVQA